MPREAMMIRLWAALDLVATLPLALPPLARVFVDVLYRLDALLGGDAVAPPFEDVHWLFIAIAGALGVLWAVVRLLRPERFLGLADASARLWVGGLIAWFVFARGLPAVLLVFVLTELAGSAAQFWSLRRRPV